MTGQTCDALCRYCRWLHTKLAVLPGYAVVLTALATWRLRRVLTAA